MRILTFRSDVTWLEFAADGTLYVTNGERSLYGWVPTLTEPVGIAIQSGWAEYREKSTLAPNGRWIVQHLFQELPPFAAMFGTKEWKPKRAERELARLRPKLTKPTALPIWPSSHPSIAFSRDSNRVFIPDSREVRVWEIETNTMSRPMNSSGHLSMPFASGNCNYLVGVVSIWEAPGVVRKVLGYRALPDFKEAINLTLPNENIDSLRPSADGIVVASTAAGRNVLVVDVLAGHVRSQFEFDETDRIATLALSCDGQLMLTAHPAGQVRFRDVGGMQRELARWVFGVGTITDLAVSLDGLMAATASGKRVVL